MGRSALIDMTLGDALEAMAIERPGSPFLTAGSVTLTYGDLWEASGRLATGLAGLGLERGDRVTTSLSNRVEWVIAAFALARLGVINVLANPRYRTGELAYLVAHSKSRCVISETALGSDFETAVEDERLDVDMSFRAYGQRIRVSDDNGDPDPAWTALLGAPHDKDLIAKAARGLGADDAVYIMYTSGTTGQPKGSMTRHGAALKNGFNSGERMGFTSDDRLLCYLPMTHCFGSVNAMLNTLTHGARFDLLPEFDPNEVLDLIEARGITAIYGVPTHFSMLCEASASRPRDLHTLVRGCCGGGEITEELQDAIDKRLGLPGLTHAYGMTESTALISQSPHTWPRASRLGTAGPPMPDVEVRISDPGTGEQCPPGVAGSIAFRGFNIHAGYFMVDADASLGADGWWATGDIGMLGADGALTILGRSKDMYKTSGFNVYPVEVETCLRDYQGVGEVAVVGVPHPVKQEVGAAFIVPAAGGTIDSDEVKSFARQRLVGYKVPSYVFVLDDFPRSSATLKIQKHVLREWAIDLIREQSSLQAQR